MITLIQKNTTQSQLTFANGNKCFRAEKQRKEWLLLQPARCDPRIRLKAPDKNLPVMLVAAGEDVFPFRMPCHVDDLKSVAAKFRRVLFGLAAPDSYAWVFPCFTSDQPFFVGRQREARNRPLEFGENHAY